MDEGDEYVPQISQMDYNLMDVSGGYYDQSMGLQQPYGADPASSSSAYPPHMNQQQQQRHPMAMGMHQQQNQMMSPTGHHLPGNYAPGMNFNPRMTGVVQTQAAPAAGKQKGTRKSKKAMAAAAAAAVTSNPGGEPSAVQQPPPAQQSLPASYQMMPPGATSMHPGQQPRMNPYTANMYAQQPQRWPSSSDGPSAAAAAAYNQQQQSAAFQRTGQAQPTSAAGFASPAYPTIPQSAAAQPQQNYYGAQARPQYYGQNPAGYPYGNMPPAAQQPVQSSRYPNPAYYNEPASAAYYPPPQQQYLQQAYNQQPPPASVSSKNQQQQQQQQMPTSQSIAQHVQVKTSTSTAAQQMPISPHYSTQPNALGQPQQQGWPGQGSQYNPPPAGAISPGYYQGQQQQQPGAYPNPQQQYQQIQQEIMECERQIQICYQQPQRTPELMQRVDQMQQKIHYLRTRLMQMQQGGLGLGSSAGLTHLQQQQQMTSVQPQQQPSMPMHPPQKYPGMQSSSNVQQLQQQQISPQIGVRHQMPPGNQDKNQDTPTSVSVMQTAASQVQVSITPEPTGRTLISVYHQYPAPNTITSTATSNPPPEYSSFYKDSIPPEPLPPKYTPKEDKQQQSSSSKPPNVVEPPRQTTATLTASFSNKSPHHESGLASTNIPISTTSSSSFTTTASAEKCRKVAELAEIGPAAPAAPMPIEGEEMGGDVELKIDHTQDNAQQENVGYDPVKRTSLVLTDQAGPEELLGPIAAVTESPADIGQNEASAVEEPKMAEELPEAEEQPPMDEVENVTEGSDNFVKLDPDEEMEEEEKPTASERKKLKATPSTSSLTPTSTPKKRGRKPAADTDEVQEKFVDLPANTDSDPEMPEKKQPKQSFSKAPYKKKASNSSMTGSRKRSKKTTTANDSDWDVDDADDLDFVVSKKKKTAKTAPKVAEPKLPEPMDMSEVNLEGFVEKRRSGRKKAEKSYGDREINYEEDEDSSSLQPLDVTKQSNEPSQDDWIVEKILGLRTVMRKKKVVKQEQLAEDKAPGGEVNGTSGNDEVSEVQSDQMELKEVIGASKEEPPVSNGVDSGAVEKEEAVEVVEEPKQSVENGEAETGVEATAPIQEAEEKEEEVEEIYVKYKGRSYLHCDWKSIDELEVMDKRALGKLNRYKLKFGDVVYNEDEEYFNEDYILVDRVLDETYDEEEKEYYAFVKWRSLAYDECTWELFKDVPDSKIDESRRRNNVVDQYKMKERSRPPPQEWTQIPLDIVYKDDNTLRDYQVEGVNWLLFCYFNQQNCILADEMGLGKTVQTITFLQGIYDKGIHGPFLIVVPLSTLHNWEREFETWTDMNAVVYHGSAASRQIIQDYEMYYSKHRPDGKKKGVIKFDALITTFEMVVSDCEFLRKINYRVCIIDEAHRLKNRNCKLLTGGLLSFKMEHRALLTGTPLQNNIHELFSLLNFLEPEQFSSSDTFLEQFGQCQTEEQVQKLQDILKPMMLRRLKEDVEKTLQPKEETIIEVQLSNIQKKYYRAILEKNFTHLLKGSSQPSLMNTMMELRKCCNHPFLINGAEEQILSEMKLMLPEKNDEELLLHGLIHSSGKLVLIDKLLPKLRQDGHKVLVFSQMVRVLDILEEFLNHMSYPFERIDGNVRGDMRQAAIDRFCKQDSERFVFLLCTRAGGLGINLTAADTVIIFDSDWNPQNDLQAQARCHRIGQTKMVKVYRLITTNTYEREMFDKASLKLGLDKAVLQNMAPKDNNQQLTRKEVEDLLRKGAYGAVMEEDTEGSKFSEEDIETILQRRTHTIRLEVGWVNQLARAKAKDIQFQPGIKGSTFAKASFKSSTNREDIDVNDPNFWAKWAKKANIDVDAAIGAKNEHLIMPHPRSRRKRFEENYKASESGEEVDGSSDTEGGSNAGKARLLDSVKNRSGKKRRRGAGGVNDEDEDYVSYTPNELAFNKSEFFKVEKLLGIWGWGRWKTIKDHSDIGLSENDMEHISRTFLLHCIREYRGDVTIRDFVWNLIIPRGGSVAKTLKKAGPAPSTIYHEGWAALPEYNPPAFAVDASFQRHINRHNNKLLQRIQQIEFLHKRVIGEKWAEVVEQDKPVGEIKLDIPSLGDAPLVPNWDKDCDHSFLIGVFKHGMENYEAMRTDPKLCFLDKNIEEMPSNLELNGKFKKLIQALRNKAEASQVKMGESQRWPKAEENEFMRILRTYGVKDDSNSANVINWSRFRELSNTLQKKSDAEMLEQLYCVLAMCTQEQGGDLSTVDKRRAESVEKISGKRAEKLMNRLHLMRKIHAIITTGIHNVRTSLKLCATDVMPKGWAETHDEHLLIAVDKFGLDDIVSKLVHLAAFEKITGLEEKILLRRVVEICTTLETGKWNGVASIEMIEDEEDLLSITHPLVKKTGAVAVSSRSSSGRSSPMNANRSRGGAVGGRTRISILSSRNKKPTSSALPSTSMEGTKGRATANITNVASLDLAELEKEKMRNLMHQSFLQKMEQATSISPNYLLSMLGLGGSGSTSTSKASSSSSNQQSVTQQQIQQMQALLAMSSLSGINFSALINPKSSGEDALNLSKRSTAKSTASSSSTKPTQSTSNMGGGSLSSGLSNLAMTKSSQLMGIVEILTSLNYSQDTHIPMVSETGVKLSGEKAPKLKNIEHWLNTHPNYTIDVQALATLQPGPSTKAESKRTASTSSAAKTPSTSTTPKALGQKPSKGSLEPGEIPKSSKQINDGGLENSVLIGVFHKSTGIALPTDKWPTLGGLQSWLDKNKECNVQNTYATVVKALPALPKSYHDRLGGDYISPPSTTPNTAANQLSAAALSQFLTGGSTSAASSLLNSQLLNSVANSNANMMSLQNMEALQMQMLVQQLMISPTMGLGSSAYNPYAALMGGAGGSSAVSDSALAAALLGLSETGGGGLTAGMPSAKAVGSSANANASVSNNSQTNTPNSSNATLASNNNMAASLLAAVANEAALTAEIMANPTLLASMLNPMAAMSQPSFGLSGMDAASAAQLTAALSALGAGSPFPTTSSNPTLRTSMTPEVQSGRSSTAVGQTPSVNAGSKKGNKGKLNAVLEKLSSGSANNNPSPNPNGSST